MHVFVLGIFAVCSPNELAVLELSGDSEDADFSTGI